MLLAEVPQRKNAAVGSGLVGMPENEACRVASAMPISSAGRVVTVGSEGVGVPDPQTTVTSVMCDITEERM